MLLTLPDAIARKRIAVAPDLNGSGVDLFDFFRRHWLRIDIGLVGDKPVLAVRQDKMRHARGVVPDVFLCLGRSRQGDNDRKGQQGFSWVCSFNNQQIVNYGRGKVKLMASIADYDRSALDRSLSPAMDFMASHPVYSSIGVKSGRRSKASNRKAGGAKKSQHLLGKALDLDVSRLSNAQKAQLLSDLASYGIKGIGIYDNNNIHIDARKNFATWGPNPKNRYAGVAISQQPKWARPALTAIQQAGPYKAFPEAPAATPGTASLAIWPSGCIIGRCLPASCLSAGDARGADATCHRTGSFKPPP